LASALLRVELARKLDIDEGGCRAGLLLLLVFGFAWELLSDAWLGLLFGDSIFVISGSLKLETA
jgi:hypothetical protein